MNPYFRQIVFSIGLIFICLSKSFAQSDTVSFFMDTVDAVASVPIEVPVKVSNFEGVVGFQFSMEWDTDSLTFDSIGHLNLFGLVPPQFNLLNTDSGVLTLSWNDPNVFNGITVEDSTAIFSLFFKAFPGCDSTAQLRFIETPTSFDVTLINDNNQVVQVPYSFGDGVIEARCPILEADFAMNGDSIQDLRVCAPFELILTDSSFGELGINQWTWDAGNGQMSTDTNTTFLYEVPGTFSASLIIEDDFSMDTVAFEVIVDPVVDVDFTFQLDPCGSTFVSFSGINNGTSNIIAWDWDFGNNTSNTGQNNFQAYNEYDTDYTVVLTVTDQNGCTSSVEKIVNIPFVALVEADPFEIQLPGCDTASGQIILETTGGLAPYTYAWSHDNTLADSTATGLSPGNYTVTVTDALGCIGTTTTFLTSIDSFPVVDLGLDTSFCIGGSINLDAGEEGEAYEWLLDDNTLVGALNSILSADQTGTYIAKVTNEFNCTTSDTLVLDVFELPEVHLGADTTICESDTLTLNAQTDASMFNWSLNNNLLNEDGQSLEVSQAGTYAVEVTDNNACSNTDEIVIVFSDPPIIELGADTTICEGEDILLQVPDEGYDYEWYLNQNTLVGSTNVLSTNLEGDYALIATNQDGCKFEDGIELEVAPLPIVDLGVDTSICWDASITFSIDSSYESYQWYRGVILLEDEQSSNFITNIPETYSVSVQSVEGCESIDTIQLEKFNIPILDIGEDTTLCFGDTLSINEIDILTDENVEIEWQFDNQVINENELLFQAGTIEAFILDTNMCEISAFKLLSISSSLIYSLPDTIIRCDGEEIQLSQEDTIGRDFMWELNESIVSLTNTVELTENGSLTLTVENDLCKELEHVLIQDGFPSLVELSEDTITSCELIPLNLALVNYDNSDQNLIQWQLNGENIMGANTPSLEVDEGGIYSINVTNGIGCSKVDSTYVSYSSPVIFDFPEDGQLTCVGRTAELEISSQGIFEIIWEKDGQVIENESSNPNMFKTTESGFYSVTVIDEIGCIYVDSVTLIQGEEPELDFGVDTIGVCIGDTLILSHDEVYFSYAWKFNGIDISNESSINVILPGTYIGAANNSIGCLGRDTVEVKLLDTSHISIVGETFFCLDMESNLYVNPSAYSIYEWYLDDQLIEEETGSSLNINDSGLYKVGYLNEFGCYSEDSLQVTVSQIETPNLQENFTFCSENQVINSNIGENYPHEWTLNDQLIQSSAVDSLVVTQGGIYTVTVFNEDNCSASDTIIITQGEIPDIDLGEDLELCEEELANFLVNEGYMYIWLLDGEAIDDETGNTLTTDKSGTYMVIATSEDGCESTDEAEVIIHPLPEIELGMDASICPEDSYNLDASCVDCEVVWNDGSTEDVRDINMAGEYIATVTNEFDCSVMDTFKLNLYEAAMPDLGEDIELCLNETVTLDPGFFSTYQWSIGTNTPSIDLIAADVFAGAVVTYWVDVSTPDGCVGSDSIRVTYLPLINGLIEAPADYVCLGDSLQLLATGGTFYEWSAINGDAVSINDPFSQDPMVSPTENTTYQVIVGNDCPTDLDTAYYEVAVLELPNGDAGQDTCIAEGTDIFLNATGGETYLWSLNEIYPLSNLESPTPRVAPMESTTYFVTITGLNGCSVMDSVLVAVAEDPSFNIIPVNIITPNGDGKNDFLEFDNLEKFPRNTLKVYNRWGNKVYEKVAYENDWDGTYQGKPLPAGSYYYILSFQSSQVVVKSALTILRE